MSIRRQETRLARKRKLSHYYVINLLDRQLPFTGIIEATNIVPPAEVGGKHIVYLPKYLPGSDGLNRMSDDKVERLFIEGLKKVAKYEILNYRNFIESSE